MSDYPPLLYLVRIAQARRATAQNVAPQVPPSPPNHPPPKSPVASQSSVREEKAKLPSSPSYITAPGACGRACGPYCASSYSTCYFFLLLYHFLLIRHALRLPLRQMLAGSPAMQFWFSPSLFLFSNGLSASTRSDQVRPDGVNGARTLDHVPRGEAITLRFWPLMGSAQKFACLIAVLPPPLPIGTGRLALRNGTPRGNLVGGLPTGPGYFGRVSLADRLPCWSLAGQPCWSVLPASRLI